MNFFLGGCANVTCVAVTMTTEVCKNLVAKRKHDVKQPQHVLEHPTRRGPCVEGACVYSMFKLQLRIFDDSVQHFEADLLRPISTDSENPLMALMQCAIIRLCVSLCGVHFRQQLVI